MKTIKKLVFEKDSPIRRVKDSRELELNVYFLVVIAAFVLILSIAGV